MELKKNKKYDLESRRPLFFGIGMVVSLSLTLVAFEWKSPIDPVVKFDSDYEKYDELIIPPTTITQPPPPLPEEPIIKETKEEPIEEPDIKIDREILENDDIKFIPPPDMPEEKPEEAVRSYAEVMPSFEGGMGNFYAFISKKIKYPQAAKRMGVQGRIFVQFIVEIDGSLSDIRVLKGIGAGCDEEALRVMRLVPQFIPAKQGDVRVPVKMIIPINFNLQ